MTQIRTVRTVIGVGAATAAVLAGTACGGSGSTAPGNQWVSPSGSAAAPAADRPTRLAKITSACTLLPAATVVKVLGGGSGTRLTAKEDPVRDADTNPKHGCTYGSNGREALSLVTSTLADRADTTAETLKKIADNSGVATKQVKGVGAGAVTYVTEGARVLAVAVPYEQELRLFVLTGPAVIPQAKLTELARLVAPQL